MEHFLLFIRYTRDTYEVKSKTRHSDFKEQPNKGKKEREKKEKRST